MVFTTEKLKCALGLEKEFETNSKLEESWIGLIKIDGKLLVVIKDYEIKVESYQERTIDKIKEEFKKGIF